MHYLSDIIDFKDVNEFTTPYSGHRWKRDDAACEALNQTLETCFQAVFRRDDSCQGLWSANDINWSAESFYVITATGKILDFNSTDC